MPAMSQPTDLPALSREDLLALVAELQRQIAELTANNDALRAELDQLTRGGKRQAAPFSKGTRVPAPKPPGRKPGSAPSGIGKPRRRRPSLSRRWMSPSRLQLAPSVAAF